MVILNADLECDLKTLL